MVWKTMHQYSQLDENLMGKIIRFCVKSRKYNVYNIYTRVAATTYNHRSFIIGGDDSQISWLKTLNPQSSIYDHLHSNPFFVLWYSANILQHRWSGAESFIMHDSDLCVSYACWVIKGRWAKAENVIYNSDNVYWYERNVTGWTHRPFSNREFQ